MTAVQQILAVNQSKELLNRDWLVGEDLFYFIVFLFIYLLSHYPPLYGNETPIMCCCAVKNLLAHFNTPFTRYNRLSNRRLYNRFDNRLYRVNKHPTGCQTGLTTVLNEQPLFVQPIIKLGCTTGLTTGCIHDTASCQNGCQTGLTTG